MTDTPEKAREIRLRRAAQRQGFTVARSRSRNPRTADYGYYAIADMNTNAWEAGISTTGHSMTLDDVEEWLTDRLVRA
jgi:hypothetical protein